MTSSFTRRLLGISNADRNALRTLMLEHLSNAGESKG